jgi:hypothetical protein
MRLPLALAALIASALPAAAQTAPDRYGARTMPYETPSQAAAASATAPLRVATYQGLMLNWANKRLPGPDDTPAAAPPPRQEQRLPPPATPLRGAPAPQAQAYRPQPQIAMAQPRQRATPPQRLPASLYDAPPPAPRVNPEFQPQPRPQPQVAMAQPPMRAAPPQRLDDTPQAPTAAPNVAPQFRPQPQAAAPIAQRLATADTAPATGGQVHLYSLHRAYGLTPDVIPPSPAGQGYVLIGPSDAPKGKETGGGAGADNDDDRPF